MTTIQNIVATANLGCPLDLAKISQGLPSVSYNPNRFGAVVYRHRRPTGTVLVFRSGKIVVVGTKFIGAATRVARAVGRKVKKLGFPVKYSEFKVHLMVASFNMGCKIDIVSLQQAHPTCTSLEPELFSGLVFRMPQNMCALIFHTGKGILTGAKTQHQIDAAYETLLPLLEEYKRVLRE